MANKDFDLDGFDFDDFTFKESDIPGTRQVKDTRKPIAEIGDHFLQGVKETFTSEDFVRRVASESLPRGYGKAINTSYEVLGTAKDLYHSAADELKPAVDSLRYMTKRALPSIKKILPSGLEKKLDEFANDAERRSSLPSQQQLDEDAIGSALADIFKTQTAAQQKDREYEEVREVARDQVADKKFRMGYKQQQSLRVGVDRLVAYQDQITSQYQRKSLELQYRQYFATRDISDAIRKDGQTTIEYLKAIAYNSALPDIQKSKFSEVRSALFEERIASGINNGVSNYIASFIPKLKERAMGHAKGFMRGVAGGLSESRNMLEMADSAGLSGAGLAGSAGGGMFADEMGYQAASRLRRHAQNIPGLRRTGNWLEDKFGNLAEKGNAWARTPTQRTGIRGFLETMGKSLFPTYSPDMNAAQSPLAKLDQVAQLNNHALRSLTEIIPGYLARILREVTITRTGDANTPLTVWNVDRGHFTTEKQAAKDITTRMFNPAQVGAFRDINNNLVKERLDPTKQLNAKQHKLMQTQLATDANAALPFDPKLWMRKGFRIRGASQTDHDAIVDHLRNHYQITDDAKGIDPRNEEVYNRFRDDRATFERMRSMMPSPEELIRVYAQAGQLETLRNLGYVVKNGFNDVIDSDRIQREMFGEDSTAGATSGPSAPSGGPSGGGSSPHGGGPHPGSGGGKRYPRTPKRGGGGGGYRRRGPGTPGHGLSVVGDEDPFDRISRDIDETHKRAMARIQKVLDKTSPVQRPAQASANLHRPGLRSAVSQMEQMQHAQHHTEHEESMGDTATAVKARYQTTEKAETVVETLLKAIQKNGEATIEALTTGLLAKESTHQSTDLDQILHLLKTRDFVHSGGTGKEIGPLRDADFGPESPNDSPELRLARKLLWMRHKAGQGGRAAVDAVGKAGRWGKTQITRGWGGLGKLWGKSKDLMQEWKDRGLDMAEDLYQRGMKHPILEYAKLKAGEYFDENGKPIHKWSDIKGAVYDKSGRIVLDAKEAARGFYDRNGKRILSTVTAKIAGLVGRITEMWKPMAWLRAARDMGRRLMQGVRDFVDQPVDIYVKGESKPRILAIVMEGGGYFSVRTGSPVLRPSQIDGEIKNDRGDTVITFADLEKGLVNVFGFPVGSFKHVLRRLAVGAFKRVKNVVHRTVNAAKGLALKGWDIAKNTFNSAKGAISGKWSWGDASKETMKQTSILERIYQLLDDRLPGKRKIFGDNDGDGVRDGSFLSELKAAKKGKDDGGPDAEFKKGGGGWGAKGAAAWGAMSDWMKKRFGKKDKDADKDKDDDDDSGNGVTNGVEQWLAEKGMGKLAKWYKGGKGVAKKYGGKLWKFGKGKVGKFAKWAPEAYAAWKMAKGVRAGAAVADGLAGAGELAAAGSTGTALATGGTLGAEALAAGGTGAEILGGSLLAEGAAGVGAGLLGLISLPVLLAAGATALVGYGAYRLYKHFKNKLSSFDKVRMAQYGIPIGDTDKSSKVRELEGVLQSHVSYDTKGNASVNVSKVKLDDLLSIFGITLAQTGNNKETLERVKRWGDWFARRFKPVWLSHLTAMHKLNPKGSLDNIEKDLDAKQQMLFLDSINVPETTYVRGASPFSVKESLVTSSRAVDNAMDDARKQLGKKGVKEDPKVAAARLAEHKTRQFPTHGTTMAIDSFNRSKGGYNPSPVAPDALKVAKLGGAAVAIASQASSMGPIDTSGLTALTAARLKAYGLSELATSSVRALMGLENAVIHDLVIRPGSKVVFNSDPNQYFTKFAQYFTITANDEVRKKIWLDWFTLRFIPVLVNYVNTVLTCNANCDLKQVDRQLSAIQRHAVAEAVVATTTKVSGSEVSVWSITSSPFLDKVINLDSHSTDGNLALLKEGAEKQPIVDPVAKNDKGADASKKAIVPKSASASVKGASANVVTPGTSTSMGITQFGRGYGATANTDLAKPDLSTFKGQAVGALGDAIKLGSGTGGNIGTMASIGKGGGWNAVKDVIMQASQMVGVDPSTMATFAYIESGFNPNAKAGTSSAGGLYQFIDKTWDAMVRRYGPTYGIDPNTPQSDPRANAIMGACYLRENAQALQKVTGRTPSAAELYMAHFLGPGTAAKLLMAPNDAPVNAVLGHKAIAANKSLFYNRMGQLKTVGEFSQTVQALVDKKGGWNVGPGTNDRVIDQSAAAGHQFKGHHGMVDLGTAANDPIKPGAAGTPAAVVPIKRDFNAKVDGGATPLPSPPVVPRSVPAAPALTAAPSQGGNLVRPNDDVKVERMQREDRTVSVMGDALSRRSNDQQASAAAQMVDLLSKSLAVQTSMDGTLKSINDSMTQLTQLTGKQVDQLLKGKSASSATSNGATPPTPPATPMPPLPVSVARNNR